MARCTDCRLYRAGDCGEYFDVEADLPCNNWEPLSSINPKWKFVREQQMALLALKQSRPLTEKENVELYSCNKTLEGI